MKFYGKLSVVPKLPLKIKGLKKIAYNLWWTWNPEARELFKMIDPEIWQKVNRNPIKLLSTVEYEHLKKLSTEYNFAVKYNLVMDKFNNYLQEENTWFRNNYNVAEDKSEVMAYFSTEFGFHKSLPIYSGGLGVLAGDHCKAVSDLGLPFVGIGLLYRQGYFKQKINNEGWQEELYPDLTFGELPLTLVKDETGKELRVSVNLAGREVVLRVWEVKVGRVSVYLLDSDVEVNNKQDRNLTLRLYGGDDETRISQEIILGVGGTRALYKMGYSPILWHMNEGHSVYLELERIRDLMKEEELEFKEAIEVVSADTVFTTHTPVPAGNESFPVDLKEKYFGDYWEEIGLNKKEFMNLGRINEEDNQFCLTVLGLKLSRFKNGVSKLHGQVSSEMWEGLWSDIPADENPITYITNGVHTLTWLAPEWVKLFDEYLTDDWRDRINHREVWEGVKDIPDDKFWQAHHKLKAKMIDFIREKDLERKSRYENGFSDSNLLSYDALTIGFARRFATYKRANLIFKDLERLSEICNKEGKEVQLIFAGKAHPADVPGKQLIKEIHEIAESEQFKGKVVLLEDYDMNLARYLVQGVDVWLNNPRRPLEASGTSGQKVAVNGGLNFSVLDGWWCEGYNGKNGWAIGRKERLKYRSDEEQDLIDSKSLYKALEEEIVPTYYNFNKNIYSSEWVYLMKEAMISNGPEYSTDRMVQEYTKRLYLPAIKQGIQIRKNGYQKAKKLANWKEKLQNNWHQIEIFSQNKGEQGSFNAKDTIQLTAQVKLGNLTSDDVQVEVCLAIENNLEELKIIPMDLEKELEDGIFRYSTEIKLQETGTYRYTFRVVPDESKLINKHELGLVKWIE
ncbi:alpha-glucan family phosphorylase [Sporohalobacter salinus]|uniref:alpha-glucan family phosphorylase n=1 Tax=Sporohalobacter salinus TaxID=1494606 RepID=UPI0019615B7C|nr:alpha-glucan family phosphorylase [Sporohalobacter salinus]MBM7624145.1 starch phosphorylase [Sporohalobacter salinus]